MTGRDACPTIRRTGLMPRNSSRSQGSVSGIEPLDSAALDDLSAALFNFHSVDDVEGWLAGW